MHFRSLLLLLLLLSFSAQASWRFHKELRLKKDNFEVIVFKYDDIQKELRWRWTLFKNNGLVVHRIFNGFVGQYVLYARENSDSFRIQLKPRGIAYANPPYVLVQFKSYDYETKEALFEVFVSDKQEEIDWFFPNEGAKGQ